MMLFVAVRMQVVPTKKEMLYRMLITVFTIKTFMLSCDEGQAPFFVAQL